MSGQRDLSDFEYQLQAERLTADAGAAGAAGGWDKTQTYTDPSDGTVYEWDAEKKGWFPKIDDYFLAAYQANYGLAQPETTPTDPAPSAPAVQPVAGTQHPAGGENPTPDEQSSASSEDGAQKRKQEPEEGWFEIEESKNHNIYVSGLPHDVTPEEFEQLMSKYGIVMEDDDGEPKLKLYRDASGEVKGDGRCCYLKIESVGLALQLLDGMQLRGSTIRAEKAKFSLKGSYNPALKKKPVKKSKKSKQSAQEKLLDWRERKAKAATNEHKTKYDKIVIVSHAFHPSEFEEDALLINEIKDDLREECGKFGVVKKILLFDRHPGGVVSVGFKEAESATACVTAMNGRWYGGRQLGVAIWDGVTNYQVEETEKEREERLKEWENFLEEGEGEGEEGGKGGGKERGKDSTATSTHQSRGEDKESGES